MYLNANFVYNRAEEKENIKKATKLKVTRQNHYSR